MFLSNRLLKAWTADNADADTPDRLIAAAEDRFGRLDGALLSVGGTPPGTVASTPDEAWRTAFESVFLGAVLDFAIIALVVFIIVKMLVRETPPAPAA